MEIEKIDDVISSAKIAFQNREYKKAIRGFEIAYQYYKDVGDDLNTAEMANNLSVAFLQNGNKRRALECVEGTDLVFEKHNEQIKQAMALGNYGASLEALKKFDQAAIAYQKSADLLQENEESELRSHVLKSLSAIQIRQGKQLESILSMQQSISDKKDLSIKERFLQFILKIPFKFLGK